VNKYKLIYNKYHRIYLLDGQKEMKDVEINPKSGIMKFIYTENELSIYVFICVLKTISILN